MICILLGVGERRLASYLAIQPGDTIEVALKATYLEFCDAVKNFYYSSSKLILFAARYSEFKSMFKKHRGSGDISGPSLTLKDHVQHSRGVEPAPFYRYYIPKTKFISKMKCIIYFGTQTSIILRCSAARE
jgi:hypothetical protein